MSVEVKFGVKINEDVKRALSVINSFLKKNEKDRKLKLFVTFDLATFDYGYVLSDDELDFSKLTIYVNPINCKRSSETGTQGHPKDYSLTNVIVHEFCHYLDDRYMISQRKKKEFDKKIFPITEYAKQSLCEEIAENLTCYLLNPYLLKEIYPDFYYFFKQIFKSPTPCTPSYFLKQYYTWNDDLKKHKELQAIVLKAKDKKAGIALIKEIKKVKSI